MHKKSTVIQKFVMTNKKVFGRNITSFVGDMEPKTCMEFFFWFHLNFLNLYHFKVNNINFIPILLFADKLTVKLVSHKNNFEFFVCCCVHFNFLFLKKKMILYSLFEYFYVTKMTNFFCVKKGVDKLFVS